MALARGSHVLCEKPLCVTVEQIERMEEAEKSSGRTVTIGYQWSFSPAIGKFKRDYLAGRFGAAKRLRTIVCWPRDELYYQRNEWAGKQRLKTGQFVLDSPVNNAAAHYLHNMLYVLGSEMNTSAMPRRLDAELWRAHPIENYDTAALRIELDSGVEVLFYASHCTEGSKGPSFIYEFERATVEYDSIEDNLKASFHDGGTIEYGSPEAEPFKKIWAAMESTRTGSSSICGIAAATPHTICVNWAQESGHGIRDFPSSSLSVDCSGKSPRRYVRNLQQLMNRCYAEGKLLSEAEEFSRFTSDYLVGSS
jgi:predicted dehydrogenase